MSKTRLSSLYRGEPRIRFLHSWNSLLPLRRWRDSGGGASRDRTDDLKLAKLALSQLSYGPIESGVLPLRPLRWTWRCAKWWAEKELNLRPHAYQACALTT